MKKTVIKLCALLLSFSIFTACSRNQFMDLSGFIYGFNRVSDDEIDFDDIYSYTDEDDNVFEIFIEDDEPNVVLKLITENDRIKQVRIAIAKMNENGNPITPSAETVSDFTETVKSSIQAFCSFDSEKTRTLMNEFGLYDMGNYKKQGELTKSQDNFHFVYFSDSLVCEMMIYNTYLEEIEKTEKPESKPAFGNTTNVRGETTPLPTFKSAG